MVDSKHNVLGGNSASQLKAYITRVENLNETITEHNEEKSSLFKEAKSCGFDVAVMKKLITRRKKDKADLEEEDALLDLYEEVMRSSTETPTEPF